MVCMMANVLADAEHDIHVIYSPREETPANLGELFAPGVTLHELKMSGPEGVFNIFPLRRLVRDLSPDIVHLHSSFAGFLGRVATLATLPRAYVYYSPHCISVMRADIRAKRFIFAALERLACIRQCTYVACSESEREAIRKWVGQDAALLENAIERPTGDWPKGEPTQGRFRVLTVGGVRYQKNPLLFAEVCKRTLAVAPDVEFVWAGDGEPHLVDAVRSAGGTVLGWKSKLQIYEILQSSSVYMSTSSWEGMPVSVIEAMSLGLPVVATRCAGNVDVISDGVTGFLFDDIEKAVEVVLDLRRDAAKRTHVGSAAMREAAQRFSVGLFKERLQEIYGLTNRAGCTHAIAEKS